MKKLTIITLLALTACKKDYTCRCSTYNSNGTPSVTQPTDNLVQAKDLSEAKTKCKAHEQKSTSFYVNCEIK